VGGANEFVEMFLFICIPVPLPPYSSCKRGVKKTYYKMFPSRAPKTNNGNNPAGDNVVTHCPAYMAPTDRWEEMPPQYDASLPDT
jgi:hypothetical protein